MTREAYIALYEKCQSGVANEQEKQQLAQYKDAFSLESTHWDEASMGNKEEVVAGMFNRLDKSIQYKKRGHRFYHLSLKVAAAIAFVIVCFGFYQFIWDKSSGNTRSLAVNISTDSVLRSASNKAVLTLADGSQIDLGDAKKGTLASQGNISIRKTSDDQIVYNLVDQNLGNGAEIRTNRITTPRGGQFRLTLPDGTQVWLNAGSTLDYPTRFTGSERRVELNGEAYFEVAENKKMPFQVLANTMRVEVLGTHFNVMSYEDEQTVEATLLEGSIKVVNDQEEKIIAPGQKAILDRSGGVMQIVEANIEAAVAWKNGYFMFNNEDVYSVMRRISRWYDVDVLYAGDVTGKRFGGTVSKFENVSEVLKTMEMTGVVHFKWKEGRIIVMP